MWGTPSVRRRHADEAGDDDDVREAEPGDPGHRDVVRRDRRCGRHARTAACSRPSSPRRPSCTPATAASSRRSPRAATSSSSARSIREALAEAGVELADVDARRRHARPGPDRRAPRRPLGGEGDRLVARHPARRRSTTSHGHVASLYLGPEPRRAAVHLPARERRAHARCSPCATTARSSGSGRRSTTRRARRSTRARGCSASATRAAPRSTRWPATGDPEAFAFPVARVPGLDFSFSGVKTALLYAVRDLGRARARGAARRPRGLVPAGDRDGADPAPARGGRARGHRPDRRRRRRRRELGAPRRAARCGPRAARALHRQRGDDRVGGAVHRSRARARGSRAWMRMRRLPERPRRRRLGAALLVALRAAPRRRGERRPTSRRPGRRAGRASSATGPPPSSAGAGSSCSRSRRSPRASPRPAASQRRSRSGAGRPGAARPA